MRSERLCPSNPNSLDHSFKIVFRLALWALVKPALNLTKFRAASPSLVHTPPFCLASTSAIMSKASEYLKSGKSVDANVEMGLVPSLVVFRYLRYPYPSRKLMPSEICMLGTPPAQKNRALLSPLLLAKLVTFPERSSSIETLNLLAKSGLAIMPSHCPLSPLGKMVLYDVLAIAATRKVVPLQSQLSLELLE